MEESFDFIVGQPVECVLSDFELFWQDRGDYLEVLRRLFDADDADHTGAVLFEIFLQCEDEILLQTTACIAWSATAAGCETSLNVADEFLRLSVAGAFGHGDLIKL